MPQWRAKTEDELRWDLIKAAVRAKVNLEVHEYRAQRVNEMLAELWPAYKASLAGETVLSIDPEYETWVRDAIEAHVSDEA